MTNYLLKSVLCSGLLLAFYYFFLEREKMHRFNRFYLLLSLAFALIIPLLTIELKWEALPVNATNAIATNNIQIEKFDEQITNHSVSINAKSESVLYLPLIGYCLISLLLLVRFIRNIHSVLIRKSNHKIIFYKGAKLVLLPENVVTYTFLNHIFVEEKEYNCNLIEEEILTHELAHVHQKHTLDILFIEIIQILFWFNPFVFLYKKAIQLNHEFLADDSVLNIHQNPKSYQLLLLDKILHTRQASLTSSFNYSITKKRLIVMTKNSNRARLILKRTAIALLSLSLAFIFCEKIYSQVQKKTSNNLSGISNELIEEFNMLVKKYGKAEKTSRGKTYQDFYETPIDIKKRLYELYLKMNQQQQDETKLAFFEMPIPVKQSPTPEMFETWKNPKAVGIWIDGKHVSNKELDKYKNTDIAELSISKLYGKAKVGRIYKYQLDLTTNKEFDKTFNARMNDRIRINSRPFLQD